MRDRSLSVIGLMIACGFGVCGFFAASEGLAVPAQDLKPGPGREVVAEHCLSCHDAVLITTPEMTRSQWRRTIMEMIDDQGMAEPAPEIIEIILNYLVATQSLEGRETLQEPC